MSALRSSLAAGLTGFHFAALQVGSFLALESVSSSAWTTYASLTAAWLGGTLVGLWLVLPRRRTIAIGVLAFEALVVLTRVFPWSSGLLPLGILSVALGGLWAGGFFAAAARARAVKGVFLHENNGFACGLVLAPVAFAFGGRTALALLPVATGGLLFCLNPASLQEPRKQAA